MTLEHARENAKVQKIIKAKQNLVVAKNIRTTHRSRKPELNIKQNDTVKVDPETEMARLYLGIVGFNQWLLFTSGHISCIRNVLLAPCDQ